MATRIYKGSKLIAGSNVINNKNNENIRVINHRGYSTVAPENTLPAYVLSKKMGYEYVECDVQKTKDGAYVLLHDSTIDRTSNGTGSVGNLTLAQLKTYDFGSWKDAKYAGTKIPTLDEFMGLCKGLGLKPYIELKNTSFTSADIGNIVNIVKSYGMIENVSFISFSATLLQYVFNYTIDCRLGLLLGAEATAFDVQNIIGYKDACKGIFIDSSVVGSTTVNLCKNNNVPLEYWTVNSYSTFDGLDSYISGYTTDNFQVEEYMKSLYMET